MMTMYEKYDCHVIDAGTHKKVNRYPNVFVDKIKRIKFTNQILGLIYFLFMIT